MCEAVAQSDAALARVWIAEDTGDLRLLASAGSPVGGGSYQRIDGAFARVERGIGKVGLIAETGEPIIVRELRGDEEWLVNPGWVARQGVRAFVGLPLRAEHRTVGVLAVFARATITNAFLDDLAFAADFIAVRLHTLGVAARRSSDVMTRVQLRGLEKQSIEAALRQSRGKVFGGSGAAAILGMKPTTLASRIKALGIAPR